LVKIQLFNKITIILYHFNLIEFRLCGFWGVVFKFIQCHNHSFIF